MVGQFIPKLIEMHRSGKFPVDRLIKTYPVERMQDALDDMHAGRVRCASSLALCSITDSYSLRRLSSRSYHGDRVVRFERCLMNFFG